MIWNDICRNKYFSCIVYWHINYIWAFFTLCDQHDMGICWGIDYVYNATWNEVTVILHHLFKSHWSWIMKFKRFLRKLRVFMSMLMFVFKYMQSDWGISSVLTNGANFSETRNRPKNIKGPDFSIVKINYAETTK